MSQFKCTRWMGALAALWGFQGLATAQLIINDTLSGAASQYNWQSLNGACLTAGNNTGSIPACVGLPYYSGRTLVGGINGRLPDPVGQGALRLSNGADGTYQTGAVVSNFTFPTNQGLEVTFTTMTYGGNNFGGSGADGIGFFMMDGNRPPSVGAQGGSLGYSCSNINGEANGVAGGYIGIGIDEYGNFSNPGDNTNTGPGFLKGRISIRGAGDVNYTSLAAQYPRYYPSNLGDKAGALHDACRTGYLFNRSSSYRIDANGYLIPPGVATTERIQYNYPYLAGTSLSGVTIANQQNVGSPLRGAATPITYSVRITQSGMLDFSYSANGGTPQTVISNRRITDSNGPLPSSFRFGFSASTGGGTNVHEITCFKAAPVAESNSSAGTSTQPSARVEAGSQLFLAYFHPTNWWGQLTAQSLQINADDSLSIASAFNWDAHCTLTGGACNATGTTVTASPWDTGTNEREMLTWNGSSGIPFRWANLTTAQKAVLTAGDGSSTATRLQYLRGNRSVEVANGGTLRSRVGVLGDIYNSSPTWVGPPSTSYEGPWKDGLYSSATMPEASGQSYTAFKAAYATRQNMVYAGANDGFMHGFRAGAYDDDGNFASTSTKPNDGREEIAYMPNAVLSTIHSTTPTLDYSHEQYSHNFFVDASPEIGDLYYNGGWHTWLFSGLGVGGNAGDPPTDRAGTAVGAFFALDVTDPSRFDESNAASLVIGEWTSSNLSCTNVANCNTNLGSVSGTPNIRRLHNGKWAVLFGNGLNSASGKAGLYIMLVEPSNGARSFLYLDTGAGTTSGIKNGIVSVTPADLDGDHITDYVYAGDVLGNVWRFDLTSSNASNWDDAAPYKLYSGSINQPITTKVAVGTVASKVVGQRARVMVGFGTGQMLPQTSTGAAQYASSARQGLFGVWDGNMDSWNSKASDGNRYQTLSSTASVTTSNLQAQTITSQTAGIGAAVGVRNTSTTKICYVNSGTTCASGGANDKKGWKLELPTTTASDGTVLYEQTIYNPAIILDNFVVNTTIPGVTLSLTCGTLPASGYTMSISMADGAANNFFVTGTTAATVGGLAFGATGTPTLARTKTKFYLLQQNRAVSTEAATGGSTSCNGIGNKLCSEINPPATGVGSRLNWKRLR